jgi:hypothetical protein
MVRFEKLIWERLVNVKALGRQREIASPKKWFTANRNTENKIAAHFYLGTGITNAAFKVVEGALAWALWKWPRDIALQRGLAMEDFLLHSERELRREVLFETIIRQGCHPYQHLFFKRRRARYYKVERGLRGFFVPDHIRKDAESRLLVDTLALKDEWESFVYTNFYSDITPTTRYSAMHRLIPLEVFNVYGLFRNEAWDRFFYNEITYDQYTEADAQAASNPFGIYNFDREDGKRKFEAEVKRFAQLYPGTIAKEGEEINFSEFYARFAIVNNKDTSKIDPKLVEELRVKLTNRKNEASSLSLPDEKVGKNILGTSWPEALAEKHRKVLM